jgi:uncharacterized iron-regulated membrane protein
MSVFSCILFTSVSGFVFFFFFFFFAWFLFHHSGSFSGATLWENPAFITPNKKRSLTRKRKANRYEQRVASKATTKKRKADATRPEDALDFQTVFQ